MQLHKHYEEKMNIKRIRTKRDFNAALKSVESLMCDKAVSPEGGRLDVIVTLIQAYEARHYPMLPRDPVEAIKFA